jgi:Protein of unknown function (DUF2723)
MYRGMVNRGRVDLLLLASAVCISRVLFRSHDLYDLDSVNFALAIERFDPSVYQPHPPGYYLYILMGRLLNFIVHDANLAFVLLSIGASCGVVIMVYKTALDWFGLLEARFSGLIFLFSPLAWFHGIVALTYSVEAFFSALLGYLCWRIECGRLAQIVPAGIILGVSAGVRQSSLLFLGPVFLFSIRHAPLRRQLAGVGAAALTLLLWFLPMIWASGGFGVYFGALVSLWRLVPGQDTIFNSSPATSIARGSTIVLIYLITFGVASFMPLFASRGDCRADNRKKLFTTVWIAPALFFFTFIFLKFVNSGYLLILVAPGCIWLGYWASKWYERSECRKSVKLGLIGFCVAVNVTIFLASPFYCSYRSVRHFENELDGIRVTLPLLGTADDILIIGFDSHSLGFRHAGYYLAKYVAVEYPEVKLQEGMGVFAMHDRNTRLLAALPVGSCARFVFFPLPSGEVSNQKYLQTIEDKVGSKNLETVRAGGFEFITGPIADLSLLFPEVNWITRSGVYPPLHSGTEYVNSREHQSIP